MTALTQSRRLFFLLLFCWLGVNLIQSVLTEINSDEAYYFMYGRWLSFGYFDHPPLVAVLVHFSSFLFEGNLGVRFLTVLLQGGTLIFIWLQLNEPGYSKPKVIQFFIIAASIVMFVVYGFITTPDSPLLFFTAVFLYCYKRFIAQQKWLFSIYLAIAMAGLVYSKYQGILVIGLVILSNLRLLKNFKFLSAILFAIILFLPHLWWQYVHGFPSFEYQLIDRASPFRWNYFFEYILNQFLVFNPFTLGLTLYILFKYKSHGPVERAQYFMIVGFLMIFWATTFRGHAEPHWTVAAAIPIIILLNNKIATEPKLRKYISRFIAPSLLLVLFARVVITTDLLPKKLDFHGKEKFYKAMEKVAGDKPVVFTASYREPSLYTFFTGKPATVISNLESRKTQYDLWKLEQTFCNQPAFIVVNFPAKSAAYKVNGAEFYGVHTDKFLPLNCLEIDFKTSETEFKVGDKIKLEYRIENKTNCDIGFADTLFQPTFYIVLLRQDKLFKIKVEMDQPINFIQSNSFLTGKAEFVIPNEVPVGSYSIGFSCYSILGLSFNSAFKKKVQVGR